MKLNIKNIKEYIYLIVPIITLLLLGGLHRYSGQQKITPKGLRGEHGKLTSQIETHIQSIARKIEDSNTYTPSSLTLKATQYGIQKNKTTNTTTLRTSFSSDDLQGIAFLEEQPLVFIKNRVLKTGDQIEGFTIQEISETNITVRDQGGKTTTINLNPNNKPEH